MIKAGLIIFILFSLLQPKSVLAMERFPSAGITPDHPLYLLDNLTENAGLLFSFGFERKNQKLTNYTAEKVAEIRIMAAKNNLPGLKKASQRYQDLANLALKNIQEAKKGMKPQAVSLAQNLLQHQEELTKISQESSGEIKNALGGTIEDAEKVRQETIKTYSQPTFSNHKKFQEALTLAKERIKKACPADGFNSWDFGVLCNGDEYHEVGGPCYWDESGKIEAFSTYSEILTFTGISSENKSLSIQCEVHCSSNNCPASEEKEKQRKKCDNPIYHLSSWQNRELLEAEQKKLDEKIAEECTTRGIRFTATKGELTEIKERDCKIIEGSCDDTKIKHPVLGNLWSARSCCCTCERPKRQNIAFTFKITPSPSPTTSSTSTPKPTDPAFLSFTCKETAEVVDGLPMKYLTVSVTGNSYKFPEFTCADNTNYKVAWCDKVKSIPKERVQDKDFVVNQFYESPQPCPEEEGMQVSCKKVKGESGLEYGQCINLRL